MIIKTGRTHLTNYPQHFENNKENPMLVIELWFNDNEKFRICRDGFIMPNLEELKLLYIGLKQSIEEIDKVNLVRNAFSKWVKKQKEVNK